LGHPNRACVPVRHRNDIALGRQRCTTFSDSSHAVGHSSSEIDCPCHLNRYVKRSCCDTCWINRNWRGSCWTAVVLVVVFPRVPAATPVVMFIRVGAGVPRSLLLCEGKSLVALWESPVKDLQDTQCNFGVSNLLSNGPDQCPSSTPRAPPSAWGLPH
jgi:hypothetical protein